MSFHPDNHFLVQEFKKQLINIPDDLISIAKENNSYYDFFIKLPDRILIPENINFSFKYLGLLKEHSPEYFNDLQLRWKKYISPELYDILKFDKCLKKGIDKLTESINNNHFGILAPEIKRTINFREYPNLENLAPVNLNNPIELNLFKKMYKKRIQIEINSVPLFIYPINISSFYRIKRTPEGKQLVLVFPKWNAYRWSTDLPNFILEEEGSKNKYFLNKKDTVHQEVIDLQMGL